VTTRQRNPRDDLILAMHAEIVRSTHELYELRDLCESHKTAPPGVSREESPEAKA
jgi:hypothetical protein